MARENLKRQMTREIDRRYQNNVTARAYKASASDFCDFARGEHIRNLQDVTREHVQAYEHTLEERGCSPATIHSRLAPICALRNINMREIEHPRRTSDHITRGRDEERNRQGRAQERDPRYERSVSLERAVGVRRAELSRLKGRDLVRDENGCLCVLVERGKGGKEQKQRILPQHEKTVLRAFEHVRDDEYVLNRSEIAPKANYHGMRAELAREAYNYYENRLQGDPGYRQELRRELMDRFDRSGTRGAQKRAKFEREVYNDAKYKVRGANRERAQEKGLPTSYDRTAMMAVSVFHLSHWRLDVTATNYLI